MTKQTFKDIKKEYIQSLKDYILEEGGIFPHLTFFGEKLDEIDCPASIISVPLSSDFVESDKAKDLFIKDVFPKLCKTLKVKFNIVGVAWSSEAWMRVANKQEEIEDYTSIPVKEEVLIINIESEFENNLEIYTIKRKGLQVTQDGEMSEKVQLIKKQGTSSMIPSMKGRFAGLYEKLKKENFE